MRYYLLSPSHELVPTEDLVEWAKAFELSRQLISTRIGEKLVSTIFLGLDHNFGEGPPELFETMAFDGRESIDEARCSTYVEAMEQHLTMCVKIWPKKKGSL